MKIRIPYPLSIGITAVACLVLSSGCATTDTTSTSKSAGDISPESAKALKEIRITEFILGPRDRIEIFVYRNDDLNRTIQISTNGMINYPLIGDIQVAGLSVFQLRNKIRDELSKYLVNPQVSINVTSVQSQKVIVLGEVNNPGLFSLEASMNVLESVSYAGGFTVNAKKKSILLIRGGLKNPELVKLNLEKALTKGDLSQNIYLQNGDIIYVPATLIENVSRFFGHLSTIISPIISMESGYFVGQQIESNQGSTTISP